LRAAPLFVIPVAAFAVLAIGTGHRAAAPLAPAASADAAARNIFLRDCAVCHGATGTGTTRGPSLVHVGAASIDFWVSTGRMPLANPGDTPTRSTPKYSRHAIDALVRYVARLTGGGPAIPDVSTRGTDVAAGGVLFRLNCAACHAWAGDGGALVERAAPSTHQASPTQIAEAIRTGPGRMPQFGRAAISPRQLDEVVAYTRSLDHPDDRGGFGLAHLGPLAEGAVAIVVALGLLIVGVRWIGTRQ
jgi:ubiquinol-cytochrome c reductase cytochrome c subunit